MASGGGHMDRGTFHLICMAAVAAMAAGAAAQAQGSLGPFSSRGQALEFAIDTVCMPYLRQGGAVATLAGKSGVPATLDGRPAARLHGFGRVVVAADPANRGCTVVVPEGDGRAARSEALSVLEGGYLLETLTGPNEAVLHSRKWTDLSEAYCFRLYGNVVEADILTSRGQAPDDPGHAEALRLRLYRSDAEALKKGVCKAFS